jgi:hypothetical protein
MGIPPEDRTVPVSVLVFNDKIGRAIFGNRMDVGLENLR